MPSEANTSSSELRVAVVDQEPERPSVLGEIACEVVGNLGDERAARMIGDTEDVHHVALELDHEQRIALQSHVVHILG